MTMTQLTYSKQLKTLEFFSEADEEATEALSQMGSVASSAGAAASSTLLLGGANPALMWALINLI